MEPVDLYVAALIDRANSVVSSCTGPNCATSAKVRRSVRESLVDTAKQYGGNDYHLREEYVRVANVVSSVYNYQCLDTTTDDACTSSSLALSTVKGSLNEKILERDVRESVSRGYGFLLILSTVTCFIAFFLLVVFGIALYLRKKPTTYVVS